MKKIKYSDYNSLMGILIDVRHPLEYKNGHDPRSINIYADKLIANHIRLLDKNKKYFIMCSKGVLSKKVVSYLDYFGYDVTWIEN